MTIRSIAGILLFLLTSRPIRAQHVVAVRGQLSNAAQRALARADELRNMVSLNLGRPPADSLEQSLANTAEDVMSTILKRKFTSLAGVATSRANGGDILYGKWENTGVDGETAWLRDLPGWVTVIIMVPGRKLTTESAVAYCENLVAWDTDTPKLSHILRGGELTLTMFADGTFASGKVRYPPDHRFTPYFGFEIDETADGFAVKLTIGKKSFGDRYQGDGSVAERFPPLRLRLAELSREKLFTEIARSELTGSSYPLTRDEIVWSELLGRGHLSTAELARLVLDGHDAPEFSRGEVTRFRLSGFMQAAIKRNQLPDYIPELERLCAIAKPDGGFLQYALPALFGFAGTGGADVSALAMRLTDRAQTAQISLYYLAEYSSSADVLATLEKMETKDEVLRSRAIGRIRERISERNIPRKAP